MLRPNRDGNVWRRFDPESVANTTGGIHHRASIVENLRAIAEDALHALPDRLLLLPLKARRDGSGSIVAAVLVGLLQDLVELLAFPCMLLKNLVDVGAHSVAVLCNALRGEVDGVALPVTCFDLDDPDSSFRRLLGQDRQMRDTGERVVPLLGYEAACAQWEESESAGPIQVERLCSFDDDVRWRPLLAFRPGPAREDLSELLHRLYRTTPRRIRIKAGGSRHSHGASQTDGVYIHPEGLCFLERVSEQGHSTDVLRPRVRRGSLFRVGSGVSIRRLNEQLWAAGWALPVAGGYDGQTVAGAISTGTHGTVLSQGPMASSVRSLDLVLADGTALRIEPSGGLSDPALLHATDPELGLVQDDDLFRAVLVNLGAFGVIHSFVLEAVPRFYLLERTTESTIAEVKEVLAGGNVYRLMDVPVVPPWVPTTMGARFPGHKRGAYSFSSTPTVAERRSPPATGFSSSPSPSTSAGAWSVPPAKPSPEIPFSSAGQFFGGRSSLPPHGSSPRCRGSCRRSGSGAFRRSSIGRSGRAAAS